MAGLLGTLKNIFFPFKSSKRPLPQHSEFPTQGNHLESGFVSHPGNPTEPEHYCKIGDCQRVPERPIDEAVRAARLIGQEAQLPLWLGMSGGVDSEAMAYAFLKAEVPFRATIARFNRNFNDFDIEHALQFCTRHKIEVDLIDIDLFEFYEKKASHVRFARECQCVSPQLAVHLHLMDQVPGVPILAGNAPRLTNYPDKGWAVDLPNYKMLCYHRYFLRRKRAGVGFFFLYTPELYYSFLRLPIMQQLIFGDPVKKKLSHHEEYMFKCQLYQDGGFDIAPRSSKFTGFERVKLHYAALTGNPHEYNRRFRAPLEKMYPLPKIEHALLSKRWSKAN